MSNFRKFIVIIIIFGQPLIAQDITMLGGDMTSSFTDRNAIQLPAPNVSSSERYDLQISGFAEFHGIKSRATGLGPKFNHVSCSACHVNNGRGPVTFKPSILGGTAMIIKVSLPGLSSDGLPRDVPKIGEQIRPHRLNGDMLYNIKLRYKTVRGRYPDGTEYTLKKPILTFDIPGYPQESLVTSLRMTPPVIGPGLLEAIPEAIIVALSDPDDLNGDGISGKPQYVLDLITKQKVLGRFGFKASHATVEQQGAAAAFNDMGVTSSILNKTSRPPELSDDALHRMVVYLAIAGVPAAQNQTSPIVVRGKELFQEIGCDDCHTMTVTTGSSINPEVENQTIHPFTDLLLHNMGRKLADDRAEFEASGSEWRTTPLWGLGFSERLSDVEARFLHDGRARTIEEAILWHGGEATRARKNFKNLNNFDRYYLLEFLRSL